MGVCKTKVPKQCDERMSIHKGDVFFDKMNIVVLGNINTGKTSLITRYCDKIYNDNKITTIGIDIKIKNISLNGDNYILKIIDTAGLEKYDSISQNILKRVSGGIICYSITDRESYDNLVRWVNMLIFHSPRDTPKLLIGTKSDLVNERKVTYEEGKEFANKYDMKFYEISSKYDINLDEAFLSLVKSKVKKDLIEKKDLIVKKPILLFYDFDEGQEIEIVVKLNNNNFISYYPKPNEIYKDSVKWNIIFRNNSKIELINNGKYFPYLFWEANYHITNEILDNGFKFISVESNDIAEKLDSLLEHIGLYDNERCDMITFWLNEMKIGKYVKFKILINDQIKSSKLIITPQPKTFIRVLLVFMSVDECDKIDTEFIHFFKKIDRIGSSVLEWGGVNLSNLS